MTMAECDENILKYTQLPDGKIVEVGPVTLRDALKEVEALEISEVSEDGIATPMVGFEDEDGAVMEFTRVNSYSWQVRVDSYKGKYLMGELLLHEAKDALRDFFHGEIIRAEKLRERGGGSNMKKSPLGGTFYRRVELGEGEAVIRESNAALQTSFILAQSGKLLLTNRRLVFLPARLFAFSKLKHLILDLADINAVEKKRGDVTNLLAGSWRKRLSVQCKGEEHIFLVRKLDDWLQMIKDTIQIEVRGVSK